MLLLRDLTVVLRVLTDVQLESHALGKEKKQSGKQRKVAERQHTGSVEEDSGTGCWEHKM
jgi:hypothetical protein